MFRTQHDKKLIIHCGSGVTACHTILALDYAGFPNSEFICWFLE